MRFALAVAALWLCEAATADDSFVVDNIVVEGLQRITEGAVFNYLPVNIGDRLTATDAREALRAVYASGFFTDVELRRLGDTLVVAVRERPAVRSLAIEGNKDIKTEDLENSLRDAGLAPGQAFNRSVLEDARRFLIHEYFDRGKYGASVETAANELPDNRVDVEIRIREGQRARIRQINVVGNHAFGEDVLLDQMSLKTGNWLSFWRKDDRYSRESLVADQETLRSYYLDRGYADFALESTQVALTPDKRDIYITMHIDEGVTYKIGSVSLSGELTVPEREIEALLLVARGQTFSRKRITQTSELIEYRLGGEGFAFAEVQPIQEIDREARTVSLDLRVVPGERVYVRQIDFNGSRQTNDEVFRRELRQMESAWLSNAALERSRQRIRRLAFVEDVDYEVTPVPGKADLVDVAFDIREGLPGQFGGGLGFSQTYGLTANGNFVHSNFLGSGERVALDLNLGDFSRVVSLTHTDPYATPDGVSRTLGFSYTDTTRLSSASSSFGTEAAAASIGYGFPLSEYSRLQAGLRLQSNELTAGPVSSRQSLDWVTENGDPFDVFNSNSGPCGQVPAELDICGTRFTALELTAGWVRDTRDRVIFPRRGHRHRASITMAPPGGDVAFFTVDYDFTGLWPLWRNLVLGVKLNLGYGDGLGDTSALPPYKHFFAGGPDSVRGFRQSRLGPVDSLGNAYGGNLLTVSQMSLILPTPERFADSTRVALFYDVGGVFDTGDTEYRQLNAQTNSPPPLLSYDFDADDLRQSVGVAVEWLAPLGTFRFSYAYPLTVRGDERSSDGATLLHPGDQVERFQFSIGRSF